MGIIAKYKTGIGSKESISRIAKAIKWIKINIKKYKIMTHKLNPFQNFGLLLSYWVLILLSLTLVVLVWKSVIFPYLRNILK